VWVSIRKMALKTFPDLREVLTDSGWDRFCRDLMAASGSPDSIGEVLEAWYGTWDVLANAEIEGPDLGEALDARDEVITATDRPLSLEEVPSRLGL